MHTRERVVLALLVIAGLTATSVLISAHTLGEARVQAVVTACLIAMLIPALHAVNRLREARRPAGFRHTGNPVRAVRADLGSSTVTTTATC
jgi:hypothetical protein